MAAAPKMADPPCGPRPPSRSWGHDRGRVLGVRARAPPLPRGGDYLPTLLYSLPSLSYLMALTDSIMSSPKTHFQLLVRVFAKYFKAYHHLQHTNCLPTTTTPMVLERIRHDLTRWIRPAFPTAQTDTIISYNAKNWTYTTLQILEDHYRSLLEGVEKEIDRLSLDNWETAIVIAVKWVKRDLPKIKTATIDRATTNLRALIAKTPQPQNSIRSASNPGPLQDPLPEAGSSTTRPLVDADIPPAKRHKKTNNLDRESTPLPHAFSLTPITPVMSPHQSPFFRPTTASLALNPKFSLRPSLRPWTPSLGPITPRTDSTPEPGPAPRSEPRPNNCPNSTPETRPTPRPGPGPETYPNNTPGPGPELRPEPRLETCRFRSHTHDGDKYKNWNLTPIRPIIVAGDSNISRLPRIPDDRIQVDCYPGANLSHANNILRNKTPVSHTVVKVLLSFGLNNRTQGNASLLKKDLDGMLEAAKIAFPQAEIFVPLINMSENLPRQFRAKINTLNYLIKDTGHHIPRLERESFSTGSDNIHWTPRTAQLM